RRSTDGRLIATLTSGPWDTDPVCSPDGRIVFYLRQKARPAVVRCAAAGCRNLIDRQGMSLSISPDGKRLAVVSTSGKKGPIVESVDAARGPAREIAEIGTRC